MYILTKRLKATLLTVQTRGLYYVVALHFIFNTWYSIKLTHQLQLFFFPFFFFCRIPERIMFVGALFMMTLGLVLWIPYGPGHPDLQIIGRKILIII